MSDYRKAREEVAKFLGIRPRVLTYFLYKKKVKNLYTTFEIPKKNGDARVIHAPKGSLKGIQLKLSDKLSEMHSGYVKSNNVKTFISHGFQKDKSIITNASAHRHKKYILNIDIADFFPSFHFGRVQGFFHKSKEFNFSKEFSTVIAQLACYEGKLPQGAPTSPIISNLIFNIVDLRILSLAKKYKLDYTRYADDMSFSTNNKAFKEDYITFIQELKDLLGENGFEINDKKTRLEYYSSRQEVTGLTVNDKINASRTFINKTRAMANQLYKINSFQINGKEGSLNQLEGRLSFINHLDYLNNQLAYRILNKKSSYKKYLSGLNAREKQYQHFLFYKYFFRPSKPTIVTEGKTDILHIKAALMKYCDKYPKLITKDDDGKFEFKVYFLKKTPRLQYFLGIVSDGADTMKNIWNFYTGRNNHANIYEYIARKSLTGTEENVNPVFLLFDNEQTEKKPLRVFLNHSGVKLEENVITKKLIANLYLQTIPLLEGKKECEIEDLYPDEVLNTKINGKTFSRENDDSEEHYGKHVLSKHIIKEYNNINFSNFVDILNAINEQC